MRHSQIRYVPRRPIRHVLRMPCQVVRESDFKLIADQTINLSENGLLVRPRMAVNPGDSVIVTFVAPFTRTFIDAEAVVARVVHGRRQHDAGPALGIQIVHMDNIARAMLHEHLPLLPMVPAARRGSC